MSDWFVYILQSLKDNRYYIDSTNNLKRRLVEHNRGKTKSLKNRRPLRLIYKEKFDSRKEVYSREKYLKSLKGGNQFKKIIGILPK